MTMMIAKAQANPYAQRDAILKTMGFGCYADYLASKLWTGIRRPPQQGTLCGWCQKTKGLVSK